MNRTKRTPLFPLPFQSGDRFEFENKHGRVTLEALGAPRPIRGVTLKDLPQEHKVTLDALEQIALITDQVRLQPFMAWGSDMTTPCCGLFRHDTASSGAFCKVVELHYLTRTTASEQIKQDIAEGRNRLPLMFY